MVRPITLVSAFAPIVLVAARLSARQSAPTCVLQCIGTAAAGSGCATSDVECLCITPSFLEQTATCLGQTCSADDAATGIAFGEQFCASIGITVSIPGAGAAPTDAQTEGSASASAVVESVSSAAESSPSSSASLTSAPASAASSVSIAASSAISAASSNASSVASASASAPSASASAPANGASSLGGSALLAVLGFGAAALL